MDFTFIILEYAFAICLFATLIGFFRTVWFISIGYTLSIIVLSILLMTFHAEQLHIYNWLQLALLLIWGLRLGSFLLKRELNTNYNKAVKEQTDASQQQPIPIKFAIWIGVSLLYALMFSPAVFSLQSPAHFGAYYMIPIGLGILIMVSGLLIEGIADQQKSRFKSQYPKRYCDIGLFKWVRCPNYLGEILTWLGSFVIALAFLQTWWQILMASFGLLCIILIMMGSTKRLEKKQKERYGEDPNFRKYIKQVPVLFPWLPIYSLENIKVYLE